jgi:hypothetical protein
VYLFGDPHVEDEVVPPFAPMFGAGSPNARPERQPVVAPRLAPADVDLLPRRPHPARSGRGR